MKRTRSGGFTLIEVALTLAILSIVAAGTVHVLQSQMNIARAKKTADEMRTWLEAGIAFYAANNAWPANTAALVAGGYMNATDTTTPWGDTYTVSVAGTQFQVSAPVQLHPEIARERLPNSAQAGNVVTARVVVPASETIHNRLLNRFGDAGLNTMQAPLNMAGNRIDNATVIAANPGNNITITGGNVDIQRSTTQRSTPGQFAQTLTNAAGTAVTAPQNAAGSINVNDILVRSVNGNQWLSQRLPNMVFKSSYIVRTNWSVTKPSCPGGAPRIFLIPQETWTLDRNENTWETNRMWARDNGSSWIVTIMNQSLGFDDYGGTAIAQVYCWFS